MCRKNSDHKKSVFGKGTKVFIGFLSAFVVYWLISAIHAAFILKKHNLSLIKAKSFDGILMEVLGFAFPVKTLVIGLVFGFVCVPDAVLLFGFAARFALCALLVLCVPPDALLPFPARVRQPGTALQAGHPPPVRILNIR